MADKKETLAGHQPAERKVIEEEECETLAGHKKAVMIGGKRFAQNKPHHERPNAVIKDCTGLTQEPNVNTETVSGAPIKENVDFTPKAAQVAHTPKPPKNVTPHTIHHINQPRK